MSSRDVMIERPASVVLATHENLQKSHELTRMQQVLQRSDLPMSARWALAKQYNQAMRTWFQDQIDKSLSVAEAGTRAAANAKIKEISQYLTQFTLELRSRYLTTMRSLGMRVEEEQIEFAISAGEKLSAALKRVEASNLTPAYKDRLVDMIDRTFDRMIDGLDNLTEDLLKTANKMESVD